MLPSLGALGKVHQLDQIYPDLPEEYHKLRPTRDDRRARGQLDIATVPRFPKAVWRNAGETDPVATRTAIEHAGAQRGQCFYRRVLNI
jgi:hypothetical protein